MNPRGTRKNKNRRTRCTCFMCATPRVALRDFKIQRATGYHRRPKAAA